jgi:lysophospholipase L1-like esterase
MCDLIMRQRLLFIGDSLTQWHDWDRRFPAHDVVNLGVSGETVEELLERRDRIRELAGAPDAVFLMTGINNVLQERYGIAGPYREIVRNFRIWWKGAAIVVQSLLPVEYSWISNDTIRDLNRKLKDIASAGGAEYLDIHAAFVDKAGKVIPGLLSDDGVHLAGEGYEAWAKVVEEYLQKRFP